MRERESANPLISVNLMLDNIHPFDQYDYIIVN